MTRNEDLRGNPKVEYWITESKKKGTPLQTCVDKTLYIVYNRTLAFKVKTFHQTLCENTFYDTV